MRIKKTLFVLILFGVLTSEEAIAQRVYEENGYAVVDCSGMAKGAVKTPQELIDSKTKEGRVRRHIQSKHPGGTQIGGVNGTTKLYVNQKVSRKFAVAPVDLLFGITWAEASGWHTDAHLEDSGNSPTAETGCAVYRGRSGRDPDGTWRLPTQRELMILYTHRGQLERTKDASFGNTGFSPFSDDYWCASEDEVDTAIVMFFSEDGVIGTQGFRTYRSFKSYDRYLTRCIKDL